MGVYVYVYIQHTFYCCYKPLPLGWAFAVLWSFPFFFFFIFLYSVLFFIFLIFKHIILFQFKAPKITWKRETSSSMVHDLSYSALLLHIPCSFCLSSSFPSSFSGPLFNSQNNDFLTLDTSLAKDP